MTPWKLTHTHTLLTPKAARLSVVPSPTCTGNTEGAEAQKPERPEGLPPDQTLDLNPKTLASPKDCTLYQNPSQSHGLHLAQRVQQWTPPLKIMK